MIRNYIKVAFRNLLKNKTFSFVNILGLAVGMAVSMLIILFVAHEYSYDKFHAKGANIIRVAGTGKYGDTKLTFSNLSENFAEIIKANNPEIQDFARVMTVPIGEPLIETTPERKFREPHFLFADAGFFRLFSFKVLQGNPEMALQKPFTVFLSESMATKYFGDENPVGKTLTYNKKHIFEVAGVIQDVPDNSTLQYNFIGSFPTHNAIMRSEYADFFKEKNKNFVGAGDWETFLLLDAPNSKAKIEQKIPSQVSFDPESPFGTLNFTLEFLPDIHFKTVVRETPVAKLTFIFSQIAILILLLAIVNYMNLTTARATARAKEVGLRKVVGAKRGALAKQFYTESALVTMLAFGLGYGLFRMLRPVFYEVLDLKIDERFLQNPFFLLPVLGVLFISILLAGSYPALILSRFAPIEVLSGKYSPGRRSAAIRKGFTVFQFTVSAGLVVCTLVIYSQLNFMRNKNLGEIRDRIVAIDLENTQGGKTSNGIIRQKIEALNGVEATTGTIYEAFSNGMSLVRAKSVVEEEATAFMQMQNFRADEHFFNTLNIKWAAKPERTLPCKNCVVVNEIGAEKLGITAKNIGQEITFGDEKKGQVVGIIKNFHLSSAKHEIIPLLMEIGSDTAQDYGMMYVRLAPTADLPKSIAAMEDIYNQYRIEKPFEYYFLDEALDKLYKEETRFGKMLGAFTGFSLFIACLGLFGLVTYMAETRTKEIGIRKVLGASVQQIVQLLSKDFITIVLVSLVFAFPLAWWAMSQWLEDFAYRIDIQWWMFAVAGIGALAIALLTVSFQAIKAAVANPVESLKNE